MKEFVIEIGKPFEFRRANFNKDSVVEVSSALNELEGNGGANWESNLLLLSWWKHKKSLRKSDKSQVTRLDCVNLESNGDFCRHIKKSPPTSSEGFVPHAGITSNLFLEDLARLYKLKYQIKLC